MTDRDKLHFIKAAKDAGWEVQATGDSTIIERDGQTVEIEYGSGGLPRKVKRIRDGKSEILSFNYIRMIEVFGWVNEKRDNERTDEKSRVERADTRTDQGPDAPARGEPKRPDGTAERS